MYKKINTPFNGDMIENLSAGDSVLISGVIYTGRDAAHKKMITAIEEGNSLPFDLENQCIYYVGPTPAKEGEIIGSAGPTTSYRMDDYTEALLDRGLKGMIGKGIRDEKVIKSMVKNKAVYFAAIGGAAAIIANAVKSAKVIAYDELGTEAVRKLEVIDLPAIVAIDSKGNNLYEREPQKFEGMYSKIINT